jgi:hypothetical protein
MPQGAPRRMKIAGREGEAPAEPQAPQERRPPVWAVIFGGITHVPIGDTTPHENRPRRRPRPRRRSFLRFENEDDDEDDDDFRGRKP